MQKTHKVVKVTNENHTRFKVLASKKGMMLDPFMSKVLDIYERQEQIKQLKRMGDL